MKGIMLGAVAAMTLVSGAAMADSGPVSAPTRGEGKVIHCRFEDGFKGQGRCEAKIRIKEYKPVGIRSVEDDGNFLEVSCDGVEIYEDGALTREKGDDLLVQGITSLRNPTPPSIQIELSGRGHDNDDNAVLTTSLGRIEGECRFKMDDLR